MATKPKPKAKVKAKTTRAKKAGKSTTKSKRTVKAKSRASKKNKAMSTLSYKGSSIDIVEGKVTPSLEINKKEIAMNRDADTGFYSSEKMPYAHFATLEEAGKAIVDEEE